MTREQGTGNREQGTGKRFWTTLLFVTCVGFFPFTYLAKVSFHSKERKKKKNYEFCNFV
jgi:hypothetical protein